MKLNPNFVNFFSEITSRAAIASYPFIGLGDKHKADEAAVNKMLDKYKADQEGGVVGASVTQEAGTLNLIIMIKRITYLENVRSTANLDWSNQGRKLGTEFVRLVKDGGTDDPTGSEIGKGQFNYTIGVYYQDPANPNKVYANPIRKIVEGKKSAKSSKIKW